MKCSDTAVIYFDDVRVPAKNIIGEEGMGFTYQMMQFQEERLAAAAISLTPCVNIINDTIAYTKYTVYQINIFGKLWKLSNLNPSKSTITLSTKSNISLVFSIL